MHCEIGGTKGPLGSVNALGATRLVHWRIRVALECLRSHNARYIMLKSEYNMNYLVLIHYEAEIYKRSSEAGGSKSCIVENLCMVLQVTCIATPLWRHDDSGVTKSTHNMNANMFKWKIIWIVCFVICVSIYFNEIYVNSNKNSDSILYERAFWKIASHSYDTWRNLWLWYFRNFFIEFARCVNDWILELSNFLALCESMHDFSCIVEITIATATPTML